MTEAERDTLMQFLHGLNQTRLPAYDKLARELVQEGVATHPHAAYLLVHRCLLLQAELERGWKVMGETPAVAAAPAVVWGQTLSDWGLNAQGSMPEDGAKPADGMAYLLRDVGKKAAEPYRSLEDKAVKFLGDNAAAVWVVIALMAIAVVYTSK